MSGVWQNKLNLLAVCFSDWQEGPSYFLREAWLGDFFSLVDRDLIFSQFVNRDSSTWLLHFLSKYCTNFALNSNLSYLWCRYPGRAFLLPLFWILETMCLKSSWFKPERGLCGNFTENLASRSLYANIPWEIINQNRCHHVICLIPC